MIKPAKHAKASKGPAKAQNFSVLRGIFAIFAEKG